MLGLVRFDYWIKKVARIVIVEEEGSVETLVFVAPSEEKLQWNLELSNLILVACLYNEIWTL